MKKSGSLEKLASKLKISLMVLLGFTIAGSGCYVSFHTNKKESSEKEKIIQVEEFYTPFVYYDFNRDSDGDGILDRFDKLPYTYGPIVDMNGNGYHDWQDMEIFPMYGPYYDISFYFGFGPFFNPFYHSHYQYCPNFYYGGYDYFYNNWNYDGDYHKKDRTKYSRTHGTKLRDNDGGRGGKSNYKGKEMIKKGKTNDDAKNVKRKIVPPKSYKTNPKSKIPHKTYSRESKSTRSKSYNKGTRTKPPPKSKDKKRN